MDLDHEIKETVEMLKEEYNIETLEALKIAVKMQHNRVLSDAFMVDADDSSFLEAIAMQFGYRRTALTPSTLVDALYSISDALR